MSSLAAQTLSLEARIAERSYPSVFQAWSPADNLPGEDRLTTLARHDLVFCSANLLRLRWDSPHQGLARGFETAGIPGALQVRRELLKKNPHMVFLLEIRYRDAPRNYLPEGHAWWKRDSSGNIEKGWAEGGFLKLDFAGLEFRKQVAAQAAAAVSSGIFDGVMLDWWNDDDDRLALVREVRAASGEKALILANANDRKTPRTAPYVNGYFMECTRTRNAADWERIADTLAWAEANLRQPRINCLETWYHKSRDDLNLMRATTALSLTLSNGYALFSDPNPLPKPDHLHNWYPFWEKTLGRPVAQGIKHEDGTVRREFERGAVAYNPFGNAPRTISFAAPRQSAATGAVSPSHALEGGDGGIYLKDPPIGADRLIWRRSNPDFAIYLPSGYGDRTNQQVVAAATPKGTLIVTWTLGAFEGAPDHRQVVSRSTDDGRTWSHPLVVDSQGIDRKGQGDGLRAQYGFPFVVPSTGRVYIFYSKNTGQNQVRQDTTAVLKFVYSDDDGISWKRGGVIPLPRCEWSHSDPKADPNWISIYAPILTRSGAVLAGVGRYKAGPDLYKGWVAPSRDRQTELVFFRFDNILTETDPSKLTVSVWPSGDKGLRIPRAGDPKFVWSNEPSLTELSDGSIFTTIRTRNDAVYYTVSADEGRTWRQPQPLRYTNGGEVVLNPNAPCPVIRSSDGRVVLLFYNRKNGGEKEFGMRDPVWLSVGRETLDKTQPVEFGQPRLFMDIHNEMPPGGTAWPQIASYSSFLEHKDKLYLFYNDSKYFILGKVVPEELLRPK